MADFNITNITTKKISMSILIWVIIIFIMFFLNQFIKTTQLKKEISKVRKELKIDYEERIKKRELIIQKLEKDNLLKKHQIEMMNNKIDSLDKVKNKIIIKYVDRIKEIKVMDSEEIKNYWNEQFN
jgi:biopolymer transport protein ExbB/TolQ